MSSIPQVGDLFSVFQLLMGKHLFVCLILLFSHIVRVALPKLPSEVPGFAVAIDVCCTGIDVCDTGLHVATAVGHLYCNGL